MTVQQLLDQAVALHKDGRLREAESLYQQVLQAQPNDPQTLGYLAGLSRQQGQMEVAVDFYWRAIKHAPRDPRLAFNLGETLRAAGRWEEASNAYQSSLSINSQFAPAWYGLGIATEKQGGDVDAIEAFRKAITIDSRLAPAHESLIACLLRGNALDEAAEACRQALAIEPNRAIFHAQQGSLLARRGDLAGAIAACSRAVQLRPDWADAYLGLADVFEKLGQPADVEAAARAAVRLNPRSARGYVYLALALDQLGRASDAEDANRKAIALDPQEPHAHGNLSRILLDRFIPEQAVALARRAVELAPHSTVLRSNLLLISNCLDTVEDRSLFAEHKRWAADFTSDIGQMSSPGPRDPDPHRPLRVGYVSPDLRQHPIPHFLEPLLVHHDRTKVVPVIYSDVAQPDSITQRLRTHVPEADWNQTRGLSDQQLAARVLRDQIDILIDLAGHTAGHRLLTFARAPAPIQITYMGYPNTTGLPASVMPYRLTDAHCDPPGLTESLHTEQLVRLPDSFLCYRPPVHSPSVGPSPAASAGFVTFGSFVGLLRITPTMVRLWSQILTRVPNSKLLLKNKAVTEPVVAQRVRDAFASHGILADRLLLVGHETSSVGHLARYGQVDIALDSFPYHGTTTTCEALWMGVPVITLAGKSHRARVGVSLLNSVGLQELISQTPEMYVELAAKLADDLARLASISTQLRMQMQASPLMNEPQFVANLEATYRRLWQVACGVSPPDQDGLGSGQGQ